MTTARPRTHVSIDCHDLARSVRFYRILLAEEPLLERPGYARFGPSELGLVLGLNARADGASAAGTGPMQHLGILYPDERSLALARARLEQSGYLLSGEDDTVCCHARLDQYFVSDPDGVRWELFFAREEVVDEPAGADGKRACCPPSCCE